MHMHIKHTEHSGAHSRADPPFAGCWNAAGSLTLPRPPWGCPRARVGSARASLDGHPTPKSMPTLSQPSLLCGHGVTLLTALTAAVTPVSPDAALLRSGLQPGRLWLF